MHVQKCIRLVDSGVFVNKISLLAPFPGILILGSVEVNLFNMMIAGNDYGPLVNVLKF